MAEKLQIGIRIQAHLDEAAQAMGRLEREMRALDGAATRAERGWNRAAKSIKDFVIAGGLANTAAAALLRVGSAVGRLPGAIVEAGIAAEGLEKRFRFAFDGAAEGAQQLDFVRSEAQRLGIDFAASAQAFSDFAAATSGTAIEGAATREVFTAVAEAARVMELSTSEAQGALAALEQIASKGTVSAEDLRGQLGERLPGAFEIAARAMGVTTAGFGEMLAHGEVMADEFLPRFARALRAHVAEDVADASGSAAAEFARLGNAIRDLKVAVAESGVLDFLTAAAGKTAAIVRGLSTPTPPPPLATRILQDGPSALKDEELDEITDAASQIARRIDTLKAEISRLGALPTARIAGRDSVELIALRDELAIAEAAYSGIQAAATARRRNAAITGATIETDIFVHQTAARNREAAATARRQTAEVEQLRDAAARRHYERERSRLQEIEDLRRAALAEIEQRPHASPAAITGAVAAINREYDALRDAEMARLAKAAQEAEAQGKAAAERTRRHAEREAERSAAAIGDAFDSLRDAELDFASPAERARAETERWRAETVAAFEAAGVAVEDYGARLDAVYGLRRAADAAAEREAAQEAADKRAAAEEAAQQALERADPFAGAEAALERLGSAAEDAGDRVGRAIETGFRSAEDALVRFATAGRLEFASLTDSILADLARIAVRRAITQPLAAALGSALGSLDFGGGGGAAIPGAAEAGNVFHAVYHAGGAAGAPGGIERLVPPAVFAGAPRLHRGGVAGLRADEVPAILQRGETVLPRGAPATAPTEVRVEVTNRGTPQRVTQADGRFDGQRLVVSLVAEDIAGGGPVAGAIGRAFAIAPRTG